MDDQVTMDSGQKVQQGSWGPVGGSIWNTWPSPSWERDMNISINDEEFVTGLDLEKTVGVLTAMDLEKEIFIKNGKGLRIRFTTGPGRTILNGTGIKKD